MACVPADLTAFFIYLLLQNLEHSCCFVRHFVASLGRAVSKLNSFTCLAICIAHYNRPNE